MKLFWTFSILVFLALVILLQVTNVHFINTPRKIGEILEVRMPFNAKLIEYSGFQPVFLDQKKAILEMKEPVANVSFLLFGAFHRVRTFPFSSAQQDADSDGYPDHAELWGEDARIFREWFVSIAMLQKATPSPAWIHRDCSGLVRFAAVEALKRHDAAWVEQTQMPALVHKDVQAFVYPFIPELGANLFLTGEGFLGFASAYHLLFYTCQKVSRERNDSVLPGDLAFFFHPQDFDFPYHVMIYTGEGLVYHTGPTDDSDGFIRLWKMGDYLDAVPVSWMPVKENPNFFGFYRFKFLNDTEKNKEGSS